MASKSPFDDNPVFKRLADELRKRGILMSDGRFRCKICRGRWIPGEKPKHDPGCAKGK